MEQLSAWFGRQPIFGGKDDEKAEEEDGGAQNGQDNWQAAQVS